MSKVLNEETTIDAALMTQSSVSALKAKFPLLRINEGDPIVDSVVDPPAVSS